MMKLLIFIFAMAWTIHASAQVPGSLSPKSGAASQDRLPDTTPRPATPDIKGVPNGSSGASTGVKEEAGEIDQERTLSHPPAESVPRGSGEMQTPRPSAGERSAPAPDRETSTPPS